MANPKRITSAVYAVFTVLAGAFVISSTYQISSAVFANSTGLGKALAPECAASVQSLTAAVDRGLAASSVVTDADEAEKRFKAGRSPEWDAPQQQTLVQACTSDPRGTEAVAAVTRFEHAAASAVRRQSSELEPVRRAALSFIR
ncbi:MAG: hypothetical protein JWP97_3696 [Labilithrix sp.]|nr:hypothetical protein [Labilithrix sp.]